MSLHTSNPLAMGLKKFCTRLALFGLFVSLPALGSESDIPHIDPETTAFEYESLLSKETGTQFERVKNPKVKEALTLGTRNLAWLKHINSFRSAGNQLSLTSQATQKGYPIDKPNEYGPTLIEQKLADLKDKLPKPMAAVLLSDSDTFPDAPPADDETYLKWAIDVNKLYESASRWTMLEPYLVYYKTQREKDLRGLYHLTREPFLENKLAKFGDVEPQKQAELKDWLTGLCANGSKTFKQCKTELDRLIKRKADLNPFFGKHLSTSQKLWESYFVLPSKRRDVVWASNNPDRTFVPFLDPQDADVKNFLVENIEDEWKLGQWALKLSFVSQQPAPHIVFVPGATPNVSGLGGNKITMDANQPITEYNVRWTIRHEYGHVLGYPDCYLEFYDESKGTMMNYQLDTTNLMCSRQGKFNELMFAELKRAYFKTGP